MGERRDASTGARGETVQAGEQDQVTVEFIDNKYRRWYVQICDRARARGLLDSVERHHVLPKSLGGTRAGANLVSLTYREHYVAHWLLTKFTVGQARKRMCHAMWALTRRKDGGRCLTSSQYERARVAHRSMLSGNKYALGYHLTDSHKEALRVLHLGKPKSQEHKNKIGLANKGKKGRLGQKLSPETRRKMSKPKSAETKAKMSAALIGNQRALGYRHTPESIAKMSAARRGRV